MDKIRHNAVEMRTIKSCSAVLPGRHGERHIRVFLLHCGRFSTILVSRRFGRIHEDSSSLELLRMFYKISSLEFFGTSSAKSAKDGADRANTQADLWDTETRSGFELDCNGASSALYKRICLLIMFIVFKDGVGLRHNQSCSEKSR